MKKLSCLFLALCLLLAGCGGGENPAEVVEEQAIFPYVIQENEDNSLEVRLDTRNLPAGSWSCQSSDGQVVDISVETQDSETVVRILGKVKGSDMLDLVCLEPGSSQECFRMRLLVQSDENGKLSLLDHSHYQVSSYSSEEAGVQSAVPYEWRLERDGSLYFSLDSPSHLNWQLQTEGEQALAVDGPLLTPRGVAFQAEALAEGSLTVLLHEPDNGCSLRVSLKVDEQLQIHVEEVTVEGELDYGAKPEEPED